MSRVLLILCFVQWLGLKPASAGQVLFAEDFSRGLSNGWQNVSFFKKASDYQIHSAGTNFYVRGVADQSCSALSVKLDLVPPPPPASLVASLNRVLSCGYFSKCGGLK